MLAFHRSFAYVVVVVNLLAGLWGLGLAARRRPAPRTFWAAVVAGQLALAVQGVAGVAVYQTRKAPGLHLFYGFVVAIAAVLAWTLRGEDPRRTVGIMGAVALFIGAVSVRAMITG